METIIVTGTARSEGLKTRLFSGGARPIAQAGIVVLACGQARPCSRSFQARNGGARAP